MTLALRDAPHHEAHQASVARGLERGKMPRTLAGLLHWYISSIREEIPERLHIHEPWHDRATTHELSEGIQPVGGSHLGTLAWSGSFRLLLEGSPSMIDEQGYYLTPIRAALSRMSRRKPFMARYLCRLAQAEGDWRRIGIDLGYPDELMETYTHEALRRIWDQSYPQAARVSV